MGTAARNREGGQQFRGATTFVVDLAKAFEGVLKMEPHLLTFHKGCPGCSVATLLMHEG